jgi:hypothetical protein
MIYNLTDKQKDLAKWIVGEVRADNLPESFTIDWQFNQISASKPRYDVKKLGRGELDALAEAKMLLITINYGSNGYESSRRCTLTGLAYHAVDTNFAEEGQTIPVSALAQPHPPEISMSLDRLRAKYPDVKKLGFLVMRFAAAKPFFEDCRSH